MKEKIKVGYVGIGCRGKGMLKRCFAQMADVEITWLCDVYTPYIEAGLEILRNAGRAEAKATTDYKDILADPEVDAIIFMTGWDGRPEMVKQAMLAGKYVGFEVGCSDTLEECFDLIETYEKTKVPIMMLETTRDMETKAIRT